MIFFKDFWDGSINVITHNQSFFGWQSNNCTFHRPLIVAVLTFASKSSQHPHPQIAMSIAQEQRNIHITCSSLTDARSTRYANHPPLPQISRDRQNERITSHAKNTPVKIYGLWWTKQNVSGRSTSLAARHCQFILTEPRTLHHAYFKQNIK